MVLICKTSRKRLPSPYRYTKRVDSPPWDSLAAPFFPSELSWRVVRLSPDGRSAQVRPQLSAHALISRFDAVLGVGGWSHTLAPLGERGLVCTLSVAGVQKAALAPYAEHADLADTAADALAAAAAFFGLRPTLELGELPWVDYDPEQRQILYEPELPEVTGVTGEDRVAPVGGDVAPSEPPPEPPAAPLPTKSAGQQAIDKLVDRLKAEGRGLQAAKLLNRYGGYGSDSGAARELYARLRELLLERPAE